jgi:hypothetical protein
MLAIPIYRSKSTPSKDTKRLWMTFVVVLTMVMAAIAVVAAEARAGSFSDGFPKQVLMKGETKLQDGNFYYGTWNWYEAGEWNKVHADGFGGFPRADTVRAGSRLHIKTNKPERPAVFRIRAYYEEPEQWSTPTEKGRLLDTTLRRVERDGKTVGWNVFFRVREPDRHYYLETSARWERVPDTHISYGMSHENFHVKTTD